MSTLPDAVFDPEEAAERGFYGYEVDPTPNENYSLQTPQDAPTPETNADAKKAAGERRDALREKLSAKEDTAPSKPTRSSPKSSSGSASE